MAGFSLFPTSIGDCGIAWEGKIIIGTYLPAATKKKTATNMAARFKAMERDPTPFVEHAIEAITALLDGKGTDLSFIPCDFSGVDPFEEKVYIAARAIPAGETLTYGEVADRIGNKNLARQVGRALGRNPFPIIVPCHRVLGANGKLIGFSAPGGVDTKLKMLTIEKASIGAGDNLFGDLPMAIKPSDKRR